MNGVAFCLVGIPPYSENHVSVPLAVEDDDDGGVGGVTCALLCLL